MNKVYHSWIQPARNQEGAYCITIQCKPNASKTSIKGLTENHDALIISLAAPPIDGEANAELIKYLSKSLKINKSSIEILKGETSRNKKLLIHHVTQEQLLALCPQENKT